MNVLSDRIARWRLEGPLRAVLFVAVFAAALCATYAYVVFSAPAQVSGRYDVYRYFGPLAYFMDHRIHDGELPLWNPLVYCGIPFAANPQTALFYPPNLARSLLTPHPTPYRTQAGLVVLMGIHLIWAAGGTYFLARLHGAGRGGGYAAAFAFAFSALMVRRACEYHFLNTLTWLPWLLVTIRHLHDAPTLRAKCSWAAAAGLVFGLSLLGGFVQIAQYMAVVAAVYFLGGTLLASIGHGTPREAASALPRDLAAGALAAGIAALVASAVLLPAEELAHYSAREAGSSVGLYADLQKSGFVHIFQDLLVYPGMKYEPEALRGSGVLALLLAIAGLTSARWRDTLLFAAIYLFLLDCAFGPPRPCAVLLSRVTPFAMSSYTRAYDVALLPFSILAGFGVDALTQYPHRRLWNALRTVVLAVLAIAALDALRQWTSPHPYLPAGRWAFAFPCIGVALMLATPWIGSIEVGPISQSDRSGWRSVRLGNRTYCSPMPLLYCALPLLVFAETLAWNVYYVPFMVHKPFKEAPDAFAESRPFPQDNARHTDHRTNRALFRTETCMTGYDPLHVERVRAVIAGSPKDQRYHRLVDDVEITADNQFGNLFLKRSFWIAREWTRGPLPDKRVAFPAATTVFLNPSSEIAVPEIPRERLPDSPVSGDCVSLPIEDASFFAGVAENDRIYSRTVRIDLTKPLESFRIGPAGGIHGALRLGYSSSMTGSIEIRFADLESGRGEWGKRMPVYATVDAQAAFEIALPDFRVMDATVTFRPRKGSRGAFRFTGGGVLLDKNDEDFRLRIVQRQANAAEVEVDGLEAPRLLVFLDAMYPGWRAYVDGQRVPIHLANGAFKAVVVPEGTHRVRFAFSPWRPHAGILGSLSGVSIAAVIFRRRNTLRRTV